MQGAHVSNVDKIKLEELRRQGETFHHDGKHAEAEAALEKALALFE